jgi:hypothetical protein
MGLREFGTLGGLVRRQKGVLSAEAPNTELSLGVCLNEEEDRRRI